MKAVRNFMTRKVYYMNKILFALFCLPATALVLAAFYRPSPKPALSPSPGTRQFREVPHIRTAGYTGPVSDESAASRSTTNRSIPAGSPFAVIELFTSEGCSSCPPADEALSKLALAYPGKVYVLGFHVDYWDRLGWKDAYSSADYTARQSDYTRVLRVKSSYTPQAIVNGWNQLLGSDEDKLKVAVEEELKNTPDKSIELHASSDGKKIKVSYKLVNAGADKLNLALVQLHAQTEVKAGENGGHTLQHVNIVRDFRTDDPGGKGTGSVSFKLPRGLTAKDCKLIAYLQNGGEWNRTISAAAETTIGEGATP
jgi:hypothetical protein